MPMEISKSTVGIPGIPAGAPVSLSLSAPSGVTLIAKDGTRFRSVRARGRRQRRSLDASDLFNRPWLITRGGLESLIADYTRIPAAGIGPGPGPVITGAALWDDEEDDDDEEDPNRDLPYGLTADGMACLLVAGPLSRATSWFTTSYAEIAASYTHAMSNPDVKGICVCWHSPGGEASSDLFDLADAMFAARGDKPCVGISYDSCYSAAYCLASCAADKLFVTRCGGVGSVGVWTAHTDLSGMLDNLGVKITLIYSGDKKVEGNPYEKLSASARADIQKDVDRIRGIFATCVAKGRACPVSDIMDTEAAIFMAEEACPLFADYVGSMDDALGYLRGMVAAANGKKKAEPGDKEDWPDETEPPAAAHEPSSGGTGSAPLASIAQRSSLYAPQAGPVPSHKTSTVDSPWDGPAQEAKLDSPMPVSTAKAYYAWLDNSKIDGGKITKNGGKFGHHMVNDGKPGAANVNGCRAVIANLNGARTAPKIPGSDRRGVYNHVAKHLRDAGVDPAPLKSEAQLAAEISSTQPAQLAPDAGPSFFGVGVMARLRAAAFATGAPGWADYQVWGDGEPVTIALRGLRAASATGVSASATGVSGGGAGSRKIELLLAPYDSTANLGSFDERYRPGCFDQGGLSGDLRVLANHAESQAYVLGRVSSGTARFWSDAKGVHAEADAPETTWAEDLLVSMRRGDIKDASAAFYILKQSFETGADGRKIRWIERAILVDGSVESFGAYPGALSSAPQSQHQDQIAVSIDGAPASAAVPASTAVSVPVSVPVPAPDHDHNRNHRARLDVLRLRD